MSTLNNAQSPGLGARLRSWFLTRKQKKQNRHDPTAIQADSVVPICSVLHVINGEYYSGAERVQDLLAQTLPEMGVQVGIACIKPGRFAEQRGSKDTPLYEIPMRGRFDIRPAFQLARIARREGYDILHAHTPRSLMIATVAGMIAKLPIVYHVHSPAAADSTKRWSNRINSLIEWFCMTWVTAVIPVSESLRQRTITAGCSPEMVHLVRNGVPARPVRPVRSKNQKEWIIGTVALFRPRKGTEILLNAMAKLHREGVPVRLRAVGPFETEEYEKTLKDRAERLGINEVIDWTGFTSDVDAELAKMDLFVLPSLFGEGLPMVVIEAMAAGVPVIASNVEGIPEAIRDRVDGLLFQSGDVDELVGAIEQFIDGVIDWTAIHQQEVDRHAEAFSTESMASGVAQVYEQIICPA